MLMVSTHNWLETAKWRASNSTRPSQALAGMLLWRETALINSQAVRPYVWTERQNTCSLPVTFRMTSLSPSLWLGEPSPEALRSPDWSAGISPPKLGLPAAASSRRVLFSTFALTASLLQAPQDIPRPPHHRHFLPQPWKGPLLQEALASLNTGTQASGGPLRPSCWVSRPWSRHSRRMDLYTPHNFFLLPFI